MKVLKPTASPTRRVFRHVPKFQQRQIIPTTVTAKFQKKAKVLFPATLSSPSFEQGKDAVPSCSVSLHGRSPHRKPSPNYIWLSAYKMF